MTEISRDNEVNLAYSDPKTQTYVSVSGKAEIVRDKAKIEEKWSSPCALVPRHGRSANRLPSPSASAKGEYWDSPSSTLVHLYGYAKAVVTGETAEARRSGKVNLS